MRVLAARFAAAAVGLAAGAAVYWMVAGHRASRFLPPVSRPAVTARGGPAAGGALDLYAADRPGMLSPAVRNFPARVYVPDSGSDTVDVIDPATYKVIDRYSSGGKEPQHVVPSWDLQHLWVINNWSSTASEISPLTGKIVRTIFLEDPYNMYYTPDGRFAIVAAEREDRLNFVDPTTMRLVQSLPVACPGIDHLDFSADGSFLIASCEFSGRLLKLDLARHTVAGTLALEPGGMPQDVKVSPDGSVFYVADMKANGVYLIDPDRFVRLGFLHTGAGAHGLYVSRDSKYLYISNRGEGSVSVLEFATRRLVAKWKIPGGSPDMGGLSADGRVLWLSGRYNDEVYALDTASGRLLARIPVGHNPHGLCVYPQPGRYSLGHTGIFR